MGRRQNKVLALCRADNDRLVAQEWRDDAIHGSVFDTLLDWMKETPVGVHDIPFSLMTEPAPPMSDLRQRLRLLQH